MFLFGNIEKNVNSILSFSEIPKIFVCVRARQVVFLSEDWKKLPDCGSVLFTVFTLKYMKGMRIESRRDQTCLSVSTLEHDCFMQVSLYTVS